MMGRDIPGWVVLSSVRKQTERAIWIKPVSSTLPLPLHQPLPLSSWPDFIQ